MGVIQAERISALGYHSPEEILAVYVVMPFARKQNLLTDGSSSFVCHPHSPHCCLFCIKLSALTPAAHALLVTDHQPLW